MKESKTKTKAEQYELFYTILTVLFALVTVLLVLTGILVFALLTDVWYIGLVCVLAGVATCVIYLLFRNFAKKAIEAAQK